MDYSDLSNDDYSDAVLGFALKKMFKKAKGKVFGKKKKQQMKKPSLNPSADGGTLQRIMAGTGQATWIAASPAGTVIRLEVRPSVPFSIRKIVFATLRSAGAGAVGINIADIQIGQWSMFAAGGQLPVDTFTADAADSLVLARSCQMGQSIFIDLVNTAAVPAGELVTCTGALIGDAVTVG